MAKPWVNWVGFLGKECFLDCFMWVPLWDCEVGKRLQKKSMEVRVCEEVWWSGVVVGQKFKVVFMVPLITILLFLQGLCCWESQAHWL